MRTEQSRSSFEILERSTFRPTVLFFALAGLASLALGAPSRAQQPTALVGGIVRQAGTSTPLADARMTLFVPDLSFFREVRSNTAGLFVFSQVPAGTYQLGAALPGWEYSERQITLVGGRSRQNFPLSPETHIGAWNIIGDTLPEELDASDMGALRPDGTIFYCHNTLDPILFDPVTGQKTFPPGSGSAQGCMNSTLLEDGSVLVVGGQNGTSPGSFTNAIPWVKRFTPQNTWVQQGNMLLPQGRWYPGLARLADGRLLIMGGGTAPSAVRTDTCEIYTPGTQSWAFTDTMNSQLEFPPSALLFDGRVLRTWGVRPELYSPAIGQWAQEAPFVSPVRGFPGHSDHSLIVLSDGRAVAIGVTRLNQPSAPMTEYFNPTTSTWSTGTSPSLVRMQTEVVSLPDGHVFVGAGDAETHAAGEPNVLGVVRRCDLFDPMSGLWRRVGDMNWYREYHAVTLLVPDGRVLTTGGTTIKFQFGPTSADIEAWSPPYLFRGVRPQLSQLSDSSPSRGQTIKFQVALATRLTRVVLMGLQTTTHWVDGGIPRRLELPVTQPTNIAQITLPSDPNLLPVGWYMLFGMVDDIPSKALILRVDP
jgi:hypothetical protein